MSNRLILRAAWETFKIVGSCFVLLTIECYLIFRYEWKALVGIVVLVVVYGIVMLFRWNLWNLKMEDERKESK